MRLANKIFLSIFISSLCICLALTIYTFVELKNTYEQDYKTRYTSIADGVTNSIFQFERMIHSLMKSAAFHIEKKIQVSGVVTNEELRIVAKKFSISGMGLANNKGDFIRSTSETFLKPGKVINLKSLCPEYLDLYNKDSEAVITPIIASKITGKTYKFYVAGINDGKYVINVGSKTYFLTESFEKILSYNPEVNAIALFTSSNHKMAEVKKKDFKGNVSEPIKKQKVFTKVIPVENGRQCCECKQKNFVDDNDNYYYKLVLNISTEKLNKKVAFAAGISISLFTILSIISLFLSRYISRKLVNEIDEINVGLKKIMNTGDLDYRFTEQGSLEILELESNLNEMVKALKSHQDEKILIVKEKGIAEVNRQVAHDIRSPISALNVLIKSAKSIPEESRSIIKTVALRIEQIADKLIHKSHEIEKVQATLEAPKLVSPVLLDQVLSGVVAEKQFHLKNKSITLSYQIEFDSKSAFARVDGVEFYRVISNIINNAVDALVNTGEIIVHVDSNDLNHIISIQDNGVGIDKTNLPHIFDREATFGKKKGTGLGLYHAKQMINLWGGDINIYTERNSGTEVVIEMPISKKPSWFVTSLDLKGVTRVVLIDDEPLNFEIWKERLQGLPVKLTYYKNYEDYAEDPHTTENTLLLIDYEFENSPLTGIDIVNDIKQFSKCIIVSGRDNDPKIIQFCEIKGVRFLYKARIDKIEIDL